MGKNDLVEAMAAGAGITKADAARAFDAAIAEVTKTLKKGGKVTIVGFCTLEVTKRAARDGINPLTKQPLHIPAKNAIKFKAGSKLKDSIN